MRENFVKLYDVLADGQINPQYYNWERLEEI
ncbi:MAG: hypothetical protein CM15mP114_04140 [Alphaproteobacteria bacterium]|nr:MAG: hypothetical protein CM15mP114_04140 [Alphaproteobacteria bacterium]